MAVASSKSFTELQPERVSDLCELGCLETYFDWAIRFCRLTCARSCRSHLNRGDREKEKWWRCSPVDQDSNFGTTRWRYKQRIVPCLGAVGLLARVRCGSGRPLLAIYLALLNDKGRHLGIAQKITRHRFDQDTDAIVVASLYIYGKQLSESQHVEILGARFDRHSERSLKKLENAKWVALAAFWYSPKLCAVSRLLFVRGIVDRLWAAPIIVSGHDSWKSHLCMCHWLDWQIYTEA